MHEPTELISNKRQNTGRRGTDKKNLCPKEETEWAINKLKWNKVEGIYQIAGDLIKVHKIDIKNPARI